VSVAPTSLQAAAGSPPEPLIWRFNPVVAEVDVFFFNYYYHQSQQKPRENSPEISTQEKKKNQTQFINQIFLEHSTTIFSSVQRWIWFSYRVRNIRA